MFTGIITDIGTIERIEKDGDTRLIIQTAYDTTGIDLGASIACSGVCLTVIDKSGAGGPGWFAVDVSDETIRRTAPGQWQQGRRLNLERAMKLGDELGGHIVTGHVDGIGMIDSIEGVGGSHHLVVIAPPEIAPFIATKGSITVDGVSLTVNAVHDRSDGSTAFDLNIIPHTWAVTALGDVVLGQEVNLEIDVLARYLARMKDYLGAR
ncbi:MULTISPECIES: riboflavin synthase [unclassified Sphingomonas]|uniref:riboflavin synthase n=1 Tax=unclassified Sphingomonas TaxID=196159 RepID=UPI000BDD8F9A|nr:MAG: riboflavin synthase [Sphingomonas sp. 12-62-6]OYX40324.1 MAG: riboflavin synthase [Sphingomonas sp. 32-62-10]